MSFDLRPAQIFRGTKCMLKRKICKTKSKNMFVTLRKNVGISIPAFWQPANITSKGFIYSIRQIDDWISTQIMYQI
jgi:hypothetical protein